MRKQGIDVFLLGGRQAGQHLFQVGFRVDAEFLAGLDQAEHGSGHLAAAWGAKEQPVLLVMPKLA